MNSKSRRLQAGMCLILLCILRSQCTPRASTCMGVGRLNEGGLTKHDGLGHKCQLLVECQTATDTLQHNTYACRARTEKIRGGGVVGHTHLSTPAVPPHPCLDGQRKYASMAQYISARFL